MAEVADNCAWKVSTADVDILSESGEGDATISCSGLGTHEDKEITRKITSNRIRIRGR